MQGEKLEIIEIELDAAPSVLALYGGEVVGRVDAAGVFRHGLFFSKAEGCRPYHRGMRHHLAGLLRLLLLRVAVSSNHSLNQTFCGASQLGLISFSQNGPVSHNLF